MTITPQKLTEELQRSKEREALFKRERRALAVAVLGERRLRAQLEDEIARERRAS